ncbi:MAG: ABC transporter ATP-binding protein [Bacteroidales bacterium]
MSNFKRILGYVRPYKGSFGMNILSNILTIVFSLFTYTLMSPFLDLLFEKVQLVKEEPVFSFSSKYLKEFTNYQLSTLIDDYGKIKALSIICLIMITAFLMRNFFRYLCMYFMATVRLGALKDLRRDVFEKMMILPISFYKDNKKGDILTRATTEIQEIEFNIFNYIEGLVRDPITILFYLATLIFMSPSLTLFVFIILPIGGGIIGWVGKSLRKESIRGQKMYAGILNMIEESVSGLRIIKAFNAIPFIRNSFTVRNEEHAHLQRKIYRRKDLSSPMSEFLSSIVIVFILYFGGQMVLGNKSSLDASSFITYILIFSQVIPSVKTLSQAYYNIQKGIASADRIYEIIDADEVIKESENALELKGFQSSIHYDDVVFKYDKDIVINHIDVEIPKGKVYALVGPSGGGKSTFVDLLPRFYDIIGGCIKIDGVDIRDLKIQNLRSLFGIVTQEPILFNDTIYNNIAFGCETATLEDVKRAAQIANAHEFIDKMENGYQANIGDRGGKLSGGQRQRVSIARAVLQNPPILILDEATSSLDTESEKLVQDALNRVMKERTSIVIAHRLSTIKYADKILVIEKGKIVEQGNHSELIEFNGIYKKLNDIQSIS